MASGSSNPTTNLVKIGNNPISYNSGNKDNGTLRVVLASDQPAITIAQATAGNLNATVVGTGTFAVQAAQSGTWDIGSITTLPTLANVTTVATVSTVTNLSQLGGQTIAMGTGTRSAGTLRTTIATDDIVQVKETPDATSTYSPTTATTTAYVTNLVIKAGAGNLFAITGYNSKTSGQFIQVHDTASLPADAAVPKLIWWVPAQSNFSLDFGGKGRYFGTGITICNSSTGPTKTIGAADCWFDALYK